jgi:hypothetical protein
VQKAQRRGGRLLWLHKGEAACGAQATLGLQGDTGDVGEMLEMLESWARCCWRRRPGQERRPARRPGHASQAAPPAPKGPTAVPRRLTGGSEGTRRQRWRSQEGMAGTAPARKTPRQ